MKILVSVLFLLSVNSTFANVFERYLGEYEVVSQNCIEDGEEVLRGCDVQNISVEHTQEALSLVTINDRGERSEKSLKEFDLSEETSQKIYKAVITSQESNATWALTINFLKGELKERVRVNETVTIFNRGDHLMYYYSYVERSTWKDDKRVFRSYKLINKE